MTKSLIFLIHFIFIVFGPLSFANDDHRFFCPRAFEHQVIRPEIIFDEVEIVHDFSRALRERRVKDLKFIKISDLFTSTNEVLLGFGKPNVFLVVPSKNKEGYIKFAAKSLWRSPSTIEDTRGLVQSGIFIRFKNLPDSAIERLQTAMEAHEGDKHITCINANCRVLGDAGFSLDDKAMKANVFAIHLLRKIMNEGFKYDGKEVAIEFIRTTPFELTDFGNKILGAEASAPIRHIKRALNIAESKADSNQPIAQHPLVEKLPSDQEYFEDLELSVSRSSKIGAILRILWGPHAFFHIKIPKRVNIDNFLTESLKPFPKENPSFVTKLKKHFLLSDFVVTKIRAQLQNSKKTLGNFSENFLLQMMRVDTPEFPNRYNLVITKDTISLARLRVKFKYIDWLLTKHVMVSGYRAEGKDGQDGKDAVDVRFASEAWSDKEGTIHININSGTYQPTIEQGQGAADLLRAVFPHYKIVFESNFEK